MADDYVRDPFYEAVILLIALGNGRPRSLAEVVDGFDSIEKSILNWEEFQDISAILLRRELARFEGTRLVRTEKGNRLLGTKDIGYEHFRQFANQIEEMPEAVDAVVKLPIGADEYSLAVSRYQRGCAAMPIIVLLLLAGGLLFIGLVGQVVARLIYGP